MINNNEQKEHNHILKSTYLLSAVAVLASVRSLVVLEETCGAVGTLDRRCWVVGAGATLFASGAAFFFRGRLSAFTRQTFGHIDILR
jgi:hypothetical protein